MKRNSWPNFLLAGSLAASTVVALILLAFPLLADVPLFERRNALAIFCVVLYCLSWGLLASGLAFTILWRDRFPTASRSGPFLFVLSLVLLLTAPLIAIFSHPHSIA